VIGYRWHTFPTDGHDDLVEVVEEASGLVLKIFVERAVPAAVRQELVRTAIAARQREIGHDLVTLEDAWIG
jgi:hypothetical protein